MKEERGKSLKEIEERIDRFANRFGINALKNKLEGKELLREEVDPKLEEYLNIRSKIIILYHLAKMYSPYAEEKKAEEFAKKAITGKETEVKKTEIKEVSPLIEIEAEIEAIKSGKIVKQRDEEIEKAVAKGVERAEEISSLLADSIKELKKFEKDNPEIKTRYREFRINMLPLGKEIYYLNKLKDEYEIKKLKYIQPTARPGVQELQYQVILKKYDEAIKAADERIKELMKDERALIEALVYQALMDRQEIMTTGFLTTSIQKQIEKAVILAYLNRRVVFLVGDTGTGKTEGLKRALEKMGKNPMIFPCGRDTSQMDLFGVGAATMTREGGVAKEEKGERKEGGEKIEIGVKPAGVTQAIKENRPIVLEEANTLDSAVLREVFPVIDGYMNRRERITLPMGLGDMKLGDDFAIFFTGNPKGEGYLGIEAFDDALSRRLWTVVVSYPPLEDIKRFMTALLIDPMTITVNESALEKARKMAEAVHLIHQLYTGEKKDFYGVGSDEQTGRGSSLRTATITLRDVREIFVGWSSRGYEGNPDKEIIAYIKRQNAPEEDKKLLLQVFAINGLLDDVPYEEVKDIIDKKTWEIWIKSKAKEEKEEKNRKESKEMK
jgi:MoxR-like ATPase